MTRALFRLFDKLMGGQWGCPHGPLGWLAARLMRIGNAKMNELALEILSAQAGDRVLEIGFGPGDTLERIAEAVGANGLAAGLDPSEMMVRQATRRLARYISEGRVELTQGRSSQMPYPDASFDRVLTVNTIYFWEHPQTDLAEVRRVTKPGGRFVLVLRALGSDDALTVHGTPAPMSLSDVTGWMRAAGFQQITDQRREAPFGPENVTAVALIGS